MIGVKLELQAKSGSGFSDYVNVGAFDIAQFGCGRRVSAVIAFTQIYASTGKATRQDR